MRNILGLNFGHDGAAAVVRDGKLASALSLERVTRKKKQAGVSEALIHQVSEAAGIGADEIEFVAFSSYFYAPENEVKILDSQRREVTRHLIDLTGGEVSIPCFAEFSGRVVPALFVHHHMAHCASAFFTSPFERSACMSVDASHFRPEACSLFAYGEGNKIRYLYCPGIMIGNAYDRFTEKLGIGPGLFKAGSLMGLAAYGKPSPLLSSRGEEFCRGWYERSFQTSDPVFIDYMWSVLTGRPPHANFSLAESDSKEAMEIAATIQALFEETLLRSVHRLYRDTEAFADGHLCLSGGSCLNANANMRILNESPFARVHLFPGCGDDGTAVGAALFAAHNHFSLPRVTYEARELMYLGREYPAPEGGRDCSVDELAQSIADGKVVAWMQGRSEFGPRALGNRSLLADPRNPEMRDHLNHGVKKREWYRPFAPVVMEEHADEWFDINVESKFMLYIARVKHPERVPAISHVDGTARLQTVAEKDNPRLYGLLKAFKEKTGVPMLVNTSLNGNGEPLVETPEDLFRFASQTTVDRLIINGWDYSVLQKS